MLASHRDVPGAEAGHRLTRLPSGTRVITAPMPERASVSVALMFGVGARHEPAQRAGLAHFMEHMVFKGGRIHPTAKVVAQAIESVGGVINAATDEETTIFWAKVPEDRLELAAEVLSDIAFEPRLEEMEVTKERGVVVEELRMYRDNPQDHVHSLFDEVMWPGHALGRDTAGTEETVATFNADLCRSFVTTHYHGGNLVACVAGAVNHDRALAVLAPLIGGRSGPRSALDDPPGPAAGDRLRFLNKRTEQANVVVGCRAVSYRDDDRYALDVLNTVLGEGMASRLFLDIREERGLAYDIHSFTIKHRDTGALAIFAGCEPRRAHATVEAIRDALARLVTEAIDADELRRAQESMAGRLRLQLESTSALCNYLGEQELLNDEILSPETITAHIDAVTAEDVRRVARRLLADGLRAALIGPFRRPERFQSLLDQPVL